MAINTDSKNLVDAVIEITAIKSKILLTENNIIQLAQRHKGLDELVSYINSPFSYVRIYPEEFDSCVLSLRTAIGNLPNAESSIIHSVKKIKEFVSKGYKIEKVNIILTQLIESNSLYNIELITELCQKEGVSPFEVSQLLLMLGISQDRDSFSVMFSNMIQIDWDGIRKLDELFETEIIPKKRFNYFNQEFINYLVKNNQDIHSIYWRNFERTIAEFFNKMGYTVELGPGYADGGVDIRIYKTSSNNNGPPLIIVQCKRYKEGNLVDINTVKALYADAIHEKAGIGLIATTSRIEPGGKEIIRARGYNVKVAESEIIKTLINGMWKIPF